ncbi:MAG: NUDIX domain-containing protein [Opitutaceae bacterium]|nr:NUDIX domain-containing protein [Opitutaceae bacterium]
MGQNLDELFDVVDEQDRVIGQLARREVHARRLRHRAVHLLVQNRAGRVFLHRRSLRKDLFPGVWDSSAAGHVGAGEDYDGTAVRELAEELGCRPERPPERLFKIEAREETGQEFVWVYRVQAEGPFVLQPEEIECGDWFAVAEIDRWLARSPQEFAPALLYLWPWARPWFV